MLDKKNPVGEFTPRKPLWKSIGIHRQKNHSDPELKARSERSQSLHDRMNSNYSQVRNTQEQEAPPQEPDSYEIVPPDNRQILNDDPAFQNVLELLKLDGENQGEFRARLETFGPDEQCSRFKEISGIEEQKTPITKKQRAEQTLKEEINDIRLYVESFRSNFIREKQHFQRLFRQLTNICNTHQSPVHEPLEHSMCESVQLQSYEVVKDRSEHKPSQQEVLDVSTQDLKGIMAELNRQLEDKKKAIQALQLKCTEIDARHSMTIVRMDNENKLLNLQLAEVMRRFETQRKALRINNDDKQTDQQKLDFQQLKSTLKIKETEVGALRGELNKQYETIQMLIQSIYELEESIKDSSNPSLIVQKDQEIDKLIARLIEVENQLQKLNVQHEQLKGECYSTHQQNFCLQQKVESFGAELTDKLKALKKQLTKENSVKLSALQYENKNLTRQIAQLTEKLTINRRQEQTSLIIKNVTDEKLTINQRNLRMRFNTCEHDAKSRASDNSNEMSAPAEPVRHYDKQTTVIKNQNRFVEPKYDISCGLLDDDIGQPMSPPNDRSAYSRQQQPFSHYRLDSKQKQRIPIINERYPPQTPYEYHRRVMDQYNDSFNQRGQNPRHSQTMISSPDYWSSPRAQYSSNNQHHRREKNIYDITSKVMANQTLIVDSELSNRRGGQNHYEVRADGRSRHGSKDTKISELSSLELQLNKLTKELRSEIAQIPSRRSK